MSMHQLISLFCLKVQASTPDLLVGKLSYIVDGVGTYYETEVNVSGEDVTVDLPDTKIETKTIKVSWPEKFGDNAILEGKIENSGKSLEVGEYDIKNGAEISLPTGEGSISLDVYNSKEDRYSQFHFSKVINSTFPA